MIALTPVSAAPAVLVFACRTRAALVERIKNAGEQRLSGEIPIPSPELDGLHLRLAVIDREIAEALCAWLLWCAS